MTDNIVNIPCEGGLDLVTPRVNLEPGRLSDCLNYDVDADGGYRRMGAEFVYTGVVDYSSLDFYAVKGSFPSNVAMPSTIYFDGGASSVTIDIINGPQQVSVDQWYILYNATAEMANQEGPIQTAFPIGFTFTIASGENIVQYSVGSVQNGTFRCDAVAKYAQVLYDQENVTGNENPSDGSWAGMFYYDQKLHVIPGATQTSLYREDGTVTWETKSYGQEMAFDSGELELKFEDYIIWEGDGATDSEDIKDEIKGGTSDATTLDYFPGRIIYWRDSTDTDREYWATVVHAYLANGSYAGSDAEGALTLYEVYDRTSGGTLTSSASGAFPLSSTGTFGKFTEGNALNFTSGGTYEPQIGDQITDGGGQTATVLKVIVDAGTWAGGDATGTLVVGEISGTGSWATSTNLDIGANANVLTTANAIADTDRGDILDNTSSNLEVVLPTNTALSTAESSYVSIIHNFLATDGSANPTAVRIAEDKCYIVNGAGFALQWDGEHLIRIRTGALVSADTPRHVSVHANRLCLGYGDGTVVMSVEGQPLNFSGTDGAIVFGFGHPITGLVPLNGDTTAVFTDSTVEMLQGTNDTNFVQRNISLDSGAIEYTAVNMGDVVYCDRHGIATLSQTEAYGDFRRNRISSLVYPWLDHRLSQKYPMDGFYGDVSTQQPRLAMPVPSKNQYKLFFNDGYVLTATMGTTLNPNRPVLTVQRIEAISTDQSFTGSSRDRLGWAYGVDANGEDIQFYLSELFNQTADTINPAIRQLDVMPVDTSDKAAYVTIGPFFISNPLMNDVVNTFTIFGEFNGCTALGFELLENYQPITRNIYAGQPTATETVTIGNSDGAFIDTDFFEKFVHMNGRARSFYLRIGPNDGTGHALHNILLQTKNRILDRS